MRYTLFAILLLVAPRGVVALTWDFDDGSTWGWTARATTFYIDAPLHSEVVDGVWRIALVPNQVPNVDLIPPVIGEDSALFDRLTLRLRLIHHSPIEGFFWMYWSNVKYNRRTDFNVNRARFREERRQRYPIEWEDITVDLRALAEAGPAVRDYPATWEDTLFNFDINIKLYEDIYGRSQDVDDLPTFLEIDSIQLTGAEELAQGELSPRDIAVEVGPPGTLFAAPDFFSLGGPIVALHGGAVGDIDGDGDADLAVGWRRNVDRKAQEGWTVASNNGLGGFESTQEILLPTRPPSDDAPFFMDLWGSDFDGDGLLDLVVRNREIFEVWYNWGDEFDPILQLSNVFSIRLADGDGDGDVDLLVWGRDGESSYVTLWINDGYTFVSSDRIVFDSEEMSPFLPAGQPLGEAAVLVWRQPCGRRLCNPPFWQLTRPWAAVQEPPLAVEVPSYLYGQPLLADFDGDGMVDLLGSPERIETSSYYINDRYYGLTLWRLNASGGWTRHSLLDWKVLSSSIATADLNGDGLLDIAMVAGNLPVGPALMVWLGQPNDIPAFEGYYPLSGEGGQILTGDVNGDGDTDLVVLGKSPGSDHGGVFVLPNQGTPATAVASEAATPTAFALGANYPNPFNPATTIPLAVPAGAKNVDLTIYNVLGQPMRQVWNGPLPAGEHELTWDGRDAQGQPIATGIYVYRLQVDEQTHTRKMVKLE